MKPHFGPEDPDPYAVDTLKRSKIAMTNAGITRQMEENVNRRTANKKVERAEDLRCRKINELVVQEEDMLEAEHKRHKQ